jgi:hypothetical protein
VSCISPTPRRPGPKMKALGARIEGAEACPAYSLLQRPCRAKFTRLEQADATLYNVVKLSRLSVDIGSERAERCIERMCQLDKRSVQSC